MSVHWGSLTHADRDDQLSDLPEQGCQMMSNTSKPAPGGQSAGPYHVVVLLGGNSGEREISLQSGAAVCQPMASRGHRVTAVDPAETDLQAYDWANVDVCFLALHGTFGEDGQVQSLLEATGVPYTGSGRHASQLAFHKSAAKERFFQAHVPTPAYTLIHRGDSAERIDQLVRSFGFPLVVKPDAQGSSLGVTIVRTPEELPAALAACFCHDSFGLIEEYVDGSEWTLGIIDEEVLPLIQVQSGRDFYD